MSVGCRVLPTAAGHLFRIQDGREAAGHTGRIGRAGQGQDGLAPYEENAALRRHGAGRLVRVVEDGGQVACDQVGLFQAALDAVILGCIEGFALDEDFPRVGVDPDLVVAPLGQSFAVGVAPGNAARMVVEELREAAVPFAVPFQDALPQGAPPPMLYPAPTA